MADPLRAEIDALTGAYAKPPQQLLPRARRLLDRIVCILSEPMLPGVRCQLLVDASEVATAWWMNIGAPPNSTWGVCAPKSKPG